MQDARRSRPVIVRANQSRRRLSSGIASALALALLGAGAPALAQSSRTELPDRLELGRDARGEPCAAVRYWSDPLTADYFADSFAITCRGATAGRPLGFVRVIRPQHNDAVEASLACAAAGTGTVRLVGTVAVRRCVDKTLGLETVVTMFDRGGRRFAATAVPTAQGPMEEALRTLAGLQPINPDRLRRSAPDIDFAALAAPAAEGITASIGVDPATALQQGLRAVRQGLHLEASRTINDSLSRLAPDTPVGLRIELLLVAALADSNLRLFESATANFSRAQQLLSDNPGIQDAAVLARKLTNYTALDQLNRRNFETAMRSLDLLASGPADQTQPLLDPAIVRSLNQVRGDDSMSGVVAVPDVATLSQLVIDAQANWARSVALLAQNRPAEAAAALAVADRSFGVLSQEQVDTRQVLWLDARLERQRARIAARIGDRDAALAAVDRAIASLTRAGADGSGIGPTLAETQIERAALRARAGAPRDAVLADFRTAVDSLIAANATGSVLPPAIEQYFDLLVAESNSNPGGDAVDQFFRAIQAVGEPAVARQFNQLQSVVTSDQALTSKVQDRAEIEREITQIRFAIAAAPSGDAAAIDALDQQRAAAEARLIAIDQELGGSKAFNAVDDRPVTVAEIRERLRPGEAYLKITEVRNYAFGMMIDAGGATIYRVRVPMAELRPLIAAARASIDGGANNLKPVFNVAAANGLYQLLVGPVSDRVLAASTLIVDPSGPLQTLPFGVLVTNVESVRRFAATRRARPYDYSAVDFLAGKVGIASALSPRSFLVARALPESTAPQPFLGFAEHAPAAMSATVAGTRISVGTNCVVERAAIEQLTRELAPVPRRELALVAAALGVPALPEMTGGAFTDSAVMARTDLDQFQVLHFATHGLKEGQWACDASPPALVTSVGDGDSDALLSFGEIAKLRLNANLVVLSACDTASGVSAAGGRAAGQEESGATLEGLVRAFLAANARAVLTTYWPISNEGESEQLISAFYRAGRRADIATALRTAQTGMMADAKTSHPLYWGAFFVVGDASKTMLSPDTMAAMDRAAAVAAATGPAADAAPGR